MKSRNLEVTALLISVVLISFVSANLSIKSFATTGFLSGPDSSAGAASTKDSTSTGARSHGESSDLENVLVLGAPVLFVPALLLILMYLFWAGSYSSYNYHHKYPHGFSYTGLGTMGGHHGSHMQPSFAAHQPQHHGGAGSGISKRLGEMDNDGTTTHLLASI